MNKKEIILNIIKELYLINRNRNYFFIDNKNKYKKLSKNNLKFHNIFFVIIDLKKFKLSELINIFYLINKSFKIHKNFLAFFNFKKEIIAHNFFPDWPGNYKFSNNLKNLFFWIKQIAANFILFKKIEFIVIKFK